MARRKKTEPRQTTVADAVESAFSDADDLRGELDEWYNNLPEAFQNGSKGEALQEAINNIEGAQAPDVPTDIENETIEYTEVTGRASRRDRLDSCVARLEAAAQVARDKANDLGNFKYDDEGNPEDGADNSGAPETEEERDNLVTELEAFADECDSATSDWGNVEFPGMYG